MLAERGRRGGETADEGGVLGAFEQIARRIVADVDQQIGRSDTGGECTGVGVAVAIDAALGMRGGGKIGRADVVAV